MTKYRQATMTRCRHFAYETMWAAREAAARSNTARGIRRCPECKGWVLT